MLVCRRISGDALVIFFCCISGVFSPDIFIFRREIMKCPKCGGVLNEYDDLFVCESCGAKFKNKSTQSERKQEEQVVQNTAIEAEVMPETKNESEKSELELLKERLAEMEKRQSEMESGGNRRNADLKGKFSQIKETKFFGFLKKWGLKVILPCTLAFILFISLMVSFVGVRGVYYNVDNPNEFYSFSSSKYEYYGDLDGEEYVDKGTWKTKNGKLYLTYKDEDFGKQTDEYYFSKQSNKVIFIGEEKDSLSEFKRVSLSKYKPSSNKKVKVTFDANGGIGDTCVSYSFGSKSKEVPQTEREGYFFKGWYKDKYGYKISGSKPYEEGKRVWEDVTYYANWWSDKTYTLTVEGTDIALELEEGDSLLSKLKETEKGYTYDYYIYGELVDENTRMPANSVTISRQQTSVKTIKLTLNAVGGTFNGVGEITKNVAYNSDFTLDVPKTEELYFAGYVIYPKNSEACILVATHDGSLTNDFWNNIYEDVTLYASWIDPATELTDYEYTINDDGICITKYIGKNAVVKIPDCVTSIGNYAFKGCTGLTSVTINNGVKSIGYDAFEGCTGLTCIYYTGGLAGWCGINVYGKIVSDTRALYIGGKKVEGDLIIPDNVKSIGYGAFNGFSGLTSITIGNSVTSIGGYAFYGCTGLKSIAIPDSVTSIGSYAFSGCTGLTVSGSATNVSMVAKQAEATSFSVIITSGTSIGEYAFGGCTELMSITIPDSVTSIGDDAFSDCTGLTSITGSAANASTVAMQAKPTSFTVNITSGTSIGKYAFAGCTGLTSITIPDSVTTIGTCAFAATELTDITIGKNVTSIGLGAFAKCPGLTSIIVEKGNTQYHNYGNCLIETKSKTLILGCKNSVIPTDGSVTSVGEVAFGGCTGLTSITIPDSVTSIGSYAFAATELTDITIGKNVTSIGLGAFAKCPGLTSIIVEKGNTQYHNYGNCLIETKSKTLILGCKNSVIPTDGSVTSVGDAAFSNCTRLTSITIPDRVTSIGNSAFRGCTGLTSITIPDRVTSIGNYAFSNCTGLTSITIPDRVTSIGYDAFAGCTGLTTIKFNGTKAQWNAISKGYSWNNRVSATEVVCKDGTVSI